MRVLIKRNEQIYGPYTEDQANGYIAAARLSYADAAQIEGTSEWRRLDSVLGHAAPPIISSVRSAAGPQKIRAGKGWLIAIFVPVGFGLLFLFVVLVGFLSTSLESAAKRTSGSGAVSQAGEPTTQAKATEGQDVVKRFGPMFGPTNKIAMRISSLSRSDAYSAGLSDGTKAVVQMATGLTPLIKNGSMSTDKFNETLSGGPDLMVSFFDVLATQNQFDATVFQEYRRGWIEGARAEASAARFHPN